MNNQLYFALCAGGIFVCYFYFGIMQEDITSHKYIMDGDNSGKIDRFTFTLSLVFFQCLLNAIFAFTARTFRPDRTPDDAHFYNYALMAVSYLGAMLASNHALQHVAYPTQVIGKSIKPIPVMVFGVVFAHKRYPMAKFLFILMITVGVGLFMYSGNKSSGKGSLHVSEPTIPYFGEILLMISLALDGVTGAVQDRVRHRHRPSAMSMMFNCNMWATVYLGFAMFATGEVWAFADFAKRHPIVIGKLFSFSLASALGQNFIFMTITHFGPLVCSVITTTRKFFTVLASVLFFGHPLLIHQWFGVILVFIGLGFDARWGKEQKNK